ncbi:MAG: EAL domain-containing protein [Lachnospiraceae bacterium]|nr:EAL domain-containing protein [Lachnospiraceae bacterium]
MSVNERIGETQTKDSLPIDLTAFQKMQDAFCESNRVYAVCFDTSCHEISRFSGDETQELFIRQYASVEMEQSLVASLSGDGLENIVSMDVEAPFLQLCGVAIRDDEEQLLGVMLVFAVVEELLSGEDVLPEGVRVTKNETFQNAVALMEILLKYYFYERFRGERLISRLEEKELSGNEMKQLLRKNEMMTAILKRMESDSDFSKVAEDILGDVGGFLDLGNASLLRLNPDESTVDMISEWTGRGSRSLMLRFIGIKKETLPFFTGRPYTISSDAILPENFQDYFIGYDITAGVFLPLFVNEKLGMYLCFTMTEVPKKWSVEEVKLLNDIKLILQNILVRRVTKNSLASSYAALDAILENAGCGICVNDVAARTMLFTNEMFQEMFSNLSDRQDFEKMLLCGKSFEEDIKEYYAEQKKGWYHVSFSSIRWVDGRMVQLSTLNDITEIKNYQKQIEEQAVTDFLTGLYNRMRFEKDLKETVRDAVRSGEQGTFIYLDLDDFKDINDGLGHTVGDEFIQKTAVALQMISRGKASVYRLGGDEFAILIPASSHEHKDSIINTIHNRFGELWHLKDGEYFCSASMGVVSFPKDGTKAEMLMQRADIAMYAAKQNGKNKIEYYSESDAKESVHRLDLERAMRQAVAEGCKEFEVYYQPFIKAEGQKDVCMGAEALVRWNSKEFGMIMPGEFIPLAEYLGMIVPIGEHVLFEACRRCKFWNDFGHPEYSVSVNLSVVQLVTGNIIDTVEQALKDSGLYANNLTLEVTETVATHDAEKIVEILGKLRSLGVHLALDDFGTGYSSLARLRELPVDELKIDKCFIDKVGKDEFSDTFVDTVSTLAKSISLRVVAEGVERDIQAEKLKAMHVDYIQGFYYDKPLSQKDFEDKYLQ